MGNVCTKRSDASVSALDTTYSRDALPTRTTPRTSKLHRSSPSLAKEVTASALEASTNDAPASSTATFCSVQMDGKRSAGASFIGKDSAENQRSAIDIFMMSRSGSAFSTHRKPVDTASGSPLHATAIAGASGEETPTDKLFSAGASMGPTTHHTVSGEFGQHTPGASSLADDTGLGGVVKATTVKPAPLRDATPLAATVTDHEPITHPNATQRSWDTEEQLADQFEEGDPKWRESDSVHFSAPPSPLANPLQAQVRRNGALQGRATAAADTPSTHVGPMQCSNSSSVVERDAVTCDVHIEVDASILSDESACGFEVVLRGLQPPTAAERAEAIRHWADLVPTTTPIVRYSVPAHGSSVL